MLALLSGLLLQAGCGAHVHHVVKENETLYSISFRYGQDFRDVARWNGIEPPYMIRPGQQIRIMAPAREQRRTVVYSPAPVATSTPTETAEPRTVVPRPAQAVPLETPAADRSATASAGVRDPGPLEWSWPVSGAANRADMATSPARRGLEFTGTRGEPVRAAAAGRVVYGGSGIPHYGNLLIIRHDERFLSAYAHNDRLLVSEGQEVAAGQQIAEMGDSGTGTNTVKLRFEIRRDGEPVDPLRHLPGR
jgi:lipoprotein NlpD